MFKILSYADMVVIIIILNGKSYDYKMQYRLIINTNCIDDMPILLSVLIHR